MYKLENYKCKDCGHEEEFLLGKEEAIDLTCPECEGLLEEWNFKNNKQRVFIQDPMR